MTSPSANRRAYSKHDFCGIFDGQGHTLTFNYNGSGSDEFVAPFRYVSVTKPADSSEDDPDVPVTIKNLNVKSTIRGSGKHAAGLIGQCWGEVNVENCTMDIDIDTNKEYAAGYVGKINNGTFNISGCTVDGTIKTSAKFAAGFVAETSGVCNLTDCLCSVTIDSSVEGDGTHGGFIGVQSKNGGNITLEGCAFIGSLLGADTNNCGGFVGWRTKQITISDSIFAPESVTVSGTGSAVFARSIASVNNSYYFYALGEDSDNQGKQGYSVTAGENVTLALSGEETQYKVSGITACKNNSGLQYNGTCYAGEEDEVSLTLSHPDTPEGYIFSGYKASAGALNEGVLTMPAENVTISGGFEFADGVGTRLVGRSISVEGDVGVNFYMEIDPEIAASETAYIQFTIPTGDKTETETIPVSEAERKDGCYVFQCDVAAKEMTSEIKAQIIDPESGKSGAVYTYSVKEYADALLSHAEGNWKFTKVAPLVKSMLNYGTAAQNYFDRNTKKPANADLSDEDRTLGEITNQLDAWENYKDIRGIVQLVHGKNEHKGRYIAFMRFLASNGFLTIINDHRGHGESIIDP